MKASVQRGPTVSYEAVATIVGSGKQLRFMNCRGGEHGTIVEFTNGVSLKVNRTGTGLVYYLDGSHEAVANVRRAIQNRNVTPLVKRIMH